MDNGNAERRAKALVAGETIVLYFILWMDIFVPILSYPPFSKYWIFATAFKNCVRIASLYFFVGRPRGLDWLGMVPGAPWPRGRDFAWALIVAAVAGAIVVLASLAGGALGAVNPMFAAAPRDRHSAFFFAGLAATSLSVGYAEEMFFRCFAQKNLESAGFPPVIVVAATSLVFGLSHSAQGALGMLEATILGAVFSIFRQKGKTIHALAFGHALYDFGIMFALL